MRQSMTATAEGLSTSLLASAIKTMSVKERQLLLASHSSLLRDKLESHCSFLRALYGMVNSSIFDAVDDVLLQLSCMAAAPDGMVIPPIDDTLLVSGCTNSIGGLGFNFSF